MNFKILYCEDNERERINIRLLLDNQLGKLKDVNLEIKCEDFEKSFKR